MKKHRSAGILIKSKDKYLLGHATNLDDKAKKEFFDKRWTIPKGLVNSGESDFDAALRETEEETGLNLRALGIVPDETPFTTLHYIVKTKTEEIDKTVVIYFVNDEEGVLQHEHPRCDSIIDGTDQPEIDQFKWVTKNQAQALVYRSLSGLFSKL